MANATEETLSGNNRTNDVKNLLATGTEATSPAAAGYARTTPVTGFDRYESITVNAVLTGATGGALNVVVETSPNGTNWYELVHFPQIAAGAAAASYGVSIQLTGELVARGKNNTTTVSLATGTAFGGHWYDRMRVRFVAGSGTSAGAAQQVEVIGRIRSH